MGAKVAKPQAGAQDGEAAGASKAPAGAAGGGSSSAMVASGTALASLEAEEETSEQERNLMQMLGSGRGSRGGKRPRTGGSGKIMDRRPSQGSVRSHWSTLEETASSASPRSPEAPGSEPSAVPGGSTHKPSGKRIGHSSRPSDAAQRSPSPGSDGSSSSSADSVLSRVLETTDKAVARYFAEYSAEQLDAEIRKTFDQFDTDKNNFLDRKKFAQAFQHMDSNLSVEDMTVLFDEVDTTGDGTIEFDEFLHFIHECLEGSVSSSSYTSSTSSTSMTISEWSSDSQALSKHPLILQVQVKEAKIIGREPTEGFFPYLIVTYGDRQRATSSVKRKTMAPKWNENFVFKVSDLTMDVVVTCYHWDGRHEGPGRLLGQATVKITNLLTDFGGSESTSDVSSSSGQGSSSKDVSSISSGIKNKGKYLGQPGHPSPVIQPSPMLRGDSDISRDKLQTASPSMLPSSIQSTPGRGGQRRAAMKQKGRIHKHGRFSFQESQRWYAFTDLEGIRIGGGSGIRIRLRPWAPAGLHKQLKIQRQQEAAQKQEETRSGLMALFSFGRQPKKIDAYDSSSSSSSGSSLSTLAESDDDAEYSSPDEVEADVLPNWSRKHAHLPNPCEMTGMYTNLFGDQTLQEQLKHLQAKKDEMAAEDEKLKLENARHLLSDNVRMEQRVEVNMMIGVVQKRLRQASSVNDMPFECGWGWKPRSRRYTSSGAICEDEFADGYGLHAYGWTVQQEEGVAENEEEKGEMTESQEEGGERRGSAKGRSDISEHSVTYQHAGAIPASPEFFQKDDNEHPSPIDPKSADTTSAGKIRELLSGRAWLELEGTEIECMKATFGHFRVMHAPLQWASLSQVDADVSNAEALKGRIAVVRRDPPNLHEQRGSHAEKVLKCVRSGAVGVLIVNSGRGYELMAPEDPDRISVDWPDEWQVPVVCVRETDVGVLTDGRWCFIDFRSNSPSSLAAAPDTVGHEKSRESLRSGGVRFEKVASPESELSAGMEESVVDEAESPKAKSPLQMIQSGAAAGVRGIKRLTLNIRYKVMPTIGLSSVALDQGMNSAQVTDDNLVISPLNRNNNRPAPGVFKRADSSTFSRISSFDRTSSLGSNNQFASFKRSLSSFSQGAAAALGVAGPKSSQIIRVAEDIVDDDDSPRSPRSPRSPSSRRSRASSTSGDPKSRSPSHTGNALGTSPMSRFKRSSSLVQAEELDPGERKLLALRSKSYDDLSADPDGSPSRAEASVSGQESKDSLEKKSRAEKRRLGRAQLLEQRSIKLTRQDSEPALFDEDNIHFAKDIQHTAPAEPATGEMEKPKMSKGALNALAKLRSSVMMTEDNEEPKETAKIEDETEEEKTMRKIVKSFQKKRSTDLISAEQKMEEGREDELTTRERLAVYMAEKKLKKAFSRAQSLGTSSKASDDAGSTNTFSRVQSGFQRTASLAGEAATAFASSTFSRIGSFQRSFSTGPLTQMMAASQSNPLERTNSGASFQRASGETSKPRLDRKWEEINRVLPLLDSAHSRPDATPGQEHDGISATARTEGCGVVGSFEVKRREVEFEAKPVEGGTGVSAVERTPRRPDSARPQRLAPQKPIVANPHHHISVAAGPAARVKKPA